MDLDRYEQFGKIDTTGILRNIEEFPGQLETAFEEMQLFALPSHYIQINHIVLLGVGANAVANSLLYSMAGSSSIAITIWDKQGVPDFVTGRTLVIACSYSGDTALTTQSFDIAAQKGAKLIGISSGGLIGSLCRKYRSPFYEIQYGAPPRLALGYIIASLYVIFVKLGILDKNIEIFKESVVLVKALNQKNKADIPLVKNTAKQLIIKVKNKIPIVIASGTLMPAANRFVQQMGESAKTLTFSTSVSDYFHLGMKGLIFPTRLQDKVHYFLFISQFSDKLEHEAAKEIISQFKRQGISFDIISVDLARTAFAEAICCIQLVDYIAYYMSINNDTNPEE